MLTHRFGQFFLFIFDLLYLQFYFIKQLIQPSVYTMAQTIQDTIITNRTSEVSASDISDDDNAVQRKLLQRYFSPMEQGSLRGSIFALLASAMGTGVFNLPERARQIGLIPFILFVFIGGLFSLIGMNFMAKLIRHRKFKSYGEMSEAAYGKVLKRISQFCIIVYPWGITICFQVIFAQFLCQIMNDQLGINLYNNRDSDQLNDVGNLYRIGFNLACLALASIFALKRDITILQKIAIVGVVSVIFNISTVVIISLTGFTRPDDGAIYRGIFYVQGDKITWFLKMDSIQTYSLYCQVIASILFCYVNHQMLFPLSLSLKRPTSKRYHKIINRAHFIQFFAYLIIGITAYLLLVQHKDIHPIAPVVIASIPTTSVVIGKILMLFALFFAVPLNMYPARQSFFDATELPRNNRNHIIITMALMCSSTAVAIFFRGVNSYFGLLGGTAGVLMAGGIPSLCYFKLRRNKLQKFQYALLILCTIITVIASVGAILSIVSPPSN